MVGAREIVLSCHGCGRKFRLSVDAGVILDHPVPCPSCDSDILTNKREKSGLQSVFGRSDVPRVAEPNAPTDSQQPSQRKFRDVTKVSMDRALLPQKIDLAPKITPKDIQLPQANAPLPESIRPRPKSNPLSHRPDQNPSHPVTEIFGTKKDPPHTEPPTKTVEAGVVNPEDPIRRDPHDDSTLVSSSVGDETESNMILTDNSDEGLKIRHDGEVVVFDKERVKQLIRSRTWLGAFEVELAGKWISLESHPMIPTLEDELKSEAKTALNTISLEFDRYTDDEKTRSSNGITFSVLPFLLLCVIGAFTYYLLLPEPEVSISPVIEIPPPQSAIDASSRVQVVAKNIALSASSFREKSQETLFELSNQSLAKSNFGDALDSLYELERRDPTDSIVIEKLVQAYLGTGSFRDARRAIIRLIVVEGRTEKSEKLFEEALSRDPSLKLETVEIGKKEGLDIDQIKMLGGGKSISFKFKKNGKNAYAFKPSQFEWEDGWEGEVAAFMFCEIATCGFRVPRSRRAKISYKNFFKLYPMGTDSQKNYAERFDDLRWETEEVDGKKVRFLYGVLKDWVPRMVDWPIEYTELWSTWLDPNVALQTQTAAFEELGLLEKKNRLIWKKLKPHMGVPVGLVAGELSNIMSFDFLVNNWDRFSEKEDFYGVNNQFSDGHFLSLDNGAAFGLRHSLRVEKRFENVRRFSRNFVASVRICDPRIDRYLFPNRTKTSKRKLTFFHERRETFLNHISELLKDNEKNNILRFQ